MSYDTFTTDEMLAIFSPSTLASICNDIDDMDATEKQGVFRATCYAALRANVGDDEARGMLNPKTPADLADELTCDICGKHAATVEDGINAGWIPSYGDADGEISEPVCSECCERYLEVDPDGELTVKGGIDLTAAQQFHKASGLTT